MTGVQFWSTNLMPEGHRFQAWSERVRALHMDWDLATPVESDYAAQIRYRTARQVRVADVRCAAFEGARDPRPGADAIAGFQLQLSGRMLCKYGGTEFAIEPGDIFMWNSLEGGTFRSVGNHQQLSLLVPLDRVPRSLAAALGESRPVSARPGAGMLSVAAGQMQAVMQELGHLDDTSVNRAVAGVLELLDSAFKPAAESTFGQRGELLTEIQQYVLERLEDSRLSVSSIAAAHDVSVRTVHLAFSEFGITAARWIRQQRLERSRRDLENAEVATTVTEVAFRWGFTDTSHFSRAFKQEFGVPPSTLLVH